MLLFAGLDLLGQCLLPTNSQANKGKHLQWAQQHLSTSFENVIWTDECSVQMETHRCKQWGCCNQRKHMCGRDGKTWKVPQHNCAAWHTKVGESHYIGSAYLYYWGLQELRRSASSLGGVTFSDKSYGMDTNNTPADSHLHELVTVPQPAPMYTSDTRPTPSTRRCALRSEGDSQRTYIANPHGYTHFHTFPLKAQRRCCAMLQDMMRIWG